ncbi:hypothetical protein BJV74DRAFT_796413 [Russula compacta]|nr:hypothetical protein BJV74DRAFT_796413 [Russula compacta]
MTQGHKDVSCQRKKSWTSGRSLIVVHATSMLHFTGRPIYPWAPKDAVYYIQYNNTKSHMRKAVLTAQQGPGSTPAPQDCPPLKQILSPRQAKKETRKTQGCSSGGSTLLRHFLVRKSAEGAVKGKAYCYCLVLRCAQFGVVYLTFCKFLHFQGGAKRAQSELHNRW